MDVDAYLVVTLTAAVLVLVVAGVLEAALAFPVAVLVLVAAGPLTLAEGLAGFVQAPVISVAALYVVAAGLKGSGAVDYLTRRLLAARTAGVQGAMLRVVLPASALSAFMSNTAAVAIMSHPVRSWAQHTGVPASKLFIPLSYGAILGGSCTLIGTSTNLVADSLMQTTLGTRLEMFSLAWIGVPVLLVGIGFLYAFAHRLLPTIPDNRVEKSQPVVTESHLPGRALLALSLLLAMVLANVWLGLEVMVSALLAAGAMLLTGCTTLVNALRSIDLRVIIVIAASFALGDALVSTGVAEAVATGLTGHLNLPPWALLAVLYLVTALFTELVTNNAAVVLMYPIALSVAVQAGVEPMPLVVAVIFAASASFISPFGYQTNLMVWALGGYKPKDFLRIGLPVSLVVAVSTIVLIPLVWSF